MYADVEFYPGPGNCTNKTRGMRALKYIMPTFLILMTLGTRLQAEETRWVISREWQGRGLMTTPLFTVKNPEWRLIYRHNSTKPFKIDVFTSDHQQVNVATTENAPFYTFVTIKKAGQFYLRIHGSDALWDVKVKQLMTSVQEWDLLQARRRLKAELEPLLSWYGDAGQKTIPVTVPHGSWKIEYSMMNEPGQMRVAVHSATNAGTFKPVTYSRHQHGKSVTWVHHPGRYKLRVNARNTPWKINLYYYPPAKPADQ